MFRFANGSDGKKETDTVVLRCPITALNYDTRSGTLLVGQGCRVVQLRDGQCEWGSAFTSDLLVPGCVIHGIRDHVVFGGRCMRILGETTPRFLNEAVLDAMSIKAGSVLLALSSGAVVLAQEDKPLIHLWSAPCDTARQYLSLRFRGSARDDKSILLAGGSVMGTLHVWSRDRFRELSGHKGAVFSLRFSETEGRLCTGGEDWTVRMWRLRDRRDNLSYELEWCGYGSTARVWDCAFWSGGVVSVGEDSCFRVWTMNGQLIKEIQAARDMRCCHVYNDIVFAGGDSGKLYLWDLTCAVQDLPSVPLSKHTRGLGQVDKTNVVTTFASQKHLRIAVTASWECIVYRRSHGAAPFTLERVLPLVDLVANNRSKNEIVKAMLIDSEDTSETVELALGTSLGKVHMIKLDKDHSVATLVWSSSHHPREITVLLAADRFLVSCSGDGSVVVMTRLGELVKSCKLPTKRSNPTAACWLASRNEAIIGDSFGNIFVLSVTKGELIRSFRKAHGRLPVTSIRPFHHGFISSGKNGQLMLFADAIFCTGSMSKFGPITQVQDFFFMNGELDGRHLVVLGTLGETLYLWDTAADMVILKIAEGFKRPFQFFPGEGLISAGVSCLLSSPQPTSGRHWQAQPQLYWHSKVTWSAAWLDHDIVVTGSEDETVKLWRDCGRELALTLDSMQSAVRAVQSFAMDSSKNDCFVAAGAGGVVQCFQMKNAADCRLLAEHRPLVCETRLLSVCILRQGRSPLLVTGGSDGFLTVFGLVCGIPHADDKDDEENDAEEEEGSTKQRRKLPAGAKLRPVVHTEYELVQKARFGDGTRAVLSLASLCTEDVVISGETDGRIRMWNFVTGECLVVASAHSAGVNCISCSKSADGILSAVTGGDDQAVALTRLTSSKDGKWSLVSSVRFEGIAATAVTGVALLSETRALAVGPDQRLTVVRLDESNASDSVWETSTVVDVGDVTCLAVHPTRSRVLVAGLGMQIKDIPSIM